MLFYLFNPSAPRNPSAFARRCQASLNGQQNVAFQRTSAPYAPLSGRKATFDASQRRILDSVIDGGVLPQRMEFPRMVHERGAGEVVAYELFHLGGED